ncbi:IQ and ubiquitin-like domain-containing protein [Spea bombifrons]|uniref:IQ and ubiquitin-like domain-containing protein n=1 Tax=Spea bombifrons TaxID=233779 RepID=UPI00234ACC93|nr:IQ and ubiquitin-like domain-containing protein [Spea bombifrons]
MKMEPTAGATSQSIDVSQQTDDDMSAADHNSPESNTAGQDAHTDLVLAEQEQQTTFEAGEQGMNQQSDLWAEQQYDNSEGQPLMDPTPEPEEVPGHGGESTPQKLQSVSCEQEQPQLIIELEVTPADQHTVAEIISKQIDQQTDQDFGTQLLESEEEETQFVQEKADESLNLRQEDNTFAEQIRSTPDEDVIPKSQPEINTSLEVSNTTATVKVMLVPDGQVVTLAFSIGYSVENLKNYFATQMKIPETVIQIMFEGRVVQDQETLVDLGVIPHGTIQLEMLSLDPATYPMKAVKLQQEYSMPDVITVRVQTGEETYQDLVVEIERLNYRKPYLGGYRHKVTGVIFHHAGTQTVPKKRPDRGTVVFCRETQTVFEKNKSQQSRNTVSTQMTKIGCYVANLTDKLLQPGRYITADEFHALRLKAVIVIQTYYRRFHARKVVQQLREEKRLRLEWEEREELRKKREKEERMRKDYERRMNPKTKEDFELLYHALELWRKEEVERINQTYSGAERRTALSALLEQETQLIASIGRHKIDADQESQQKAIQLLLDKCCEPKRWKTFDGKTTEMDTQYTIRARELRDIYTTINTKELNRDERLDALLTLKHTVKEHDCKLTKEIVELIDREVDLLMRGVKGCNLDGLRKRISTLFLQYIKTPTFNPEVARLLKVPQDFTVLRKNIYFCPSCKNYLPSTEFSLSASARTVGRCRKCSKLDNEARKREEFSKYNNLLKQLKKAEADYGDEARIAFLLQQQDLQYLVENIWAAQSALSACDDIYDLAMVRWDKYYEWSPWNCILLNKEEAAAHLKLSNAEQAYGTIFIHKIKHRHTLARNYFSQIPEIAPFLHVERWNQMSTVNDLVISNTVTAPSHA